MANRSLGQEAAPRPPMTVDVQKEALHTGIVAGLGFALWMAIVALKGASKK